MRMLLHVPLLAQVPFASALTPLVEGIMATDLRRFRDIMQQEQTVKP